MSRTTLTAGENQLLADLYEAGVRTVDDLPYTSEFEQMWIRFNQSTGRNLDKHAFWRALSNARKKRELSRKVR